MRKRILKENGVKELQIIEDLLIEAQGYIDTAINVRGYNDWDENVVDAFNSLTDVLFSWDTKIINVINVNRPNNEIIHSIREDLETIKDTTDDKNYKSFNSKLKGLYVDLTETIEDIQEIIDSLNKRKPLKESKPLRIPQLKYFKMRDIEYYDDKIIFDGTFEDSEGNVFDTGIECELSKYGKNLSNDEIDNIYNDIMDCVRKHKLLLSYNPDNKGFDIDFGGFDNPHIENIYSNIKVNDYDINESRKRKPLKESLDKIELTEYTDSEALYKAFSEVDDLSEIYFNNINVYDAYKKMKKIEYPKNLGPDGRSIEQGHPESEAVLKRLYYNCNKLEQNFYALYELNWDDKDTDEYDFVLLELDGDKLTIESTWDCIVEDDDLTGLSGVNENDLVQLPL